MRNQSILQSGFGAHNSLPNISGVIWGKYLNKKNRELQIALSKLDLAVDRPDVAMDTSEMGEEKESRQHPKSALDQPKNALVWIYFIKQFDLIILIVA
jgi:hypothetical protein